MDGGGSEAPPAATALQVVGGGSPCCCAIIANGRGLGAREDDGGESGTHDVLYWAQWKEV